MPGTLVHYGCEDQRALPHTCVGVLEDEPQHQGLRESR